MTLAQKSTLDPDARKRAIARIARDLHAHLTFQAELGASGLPPEDPDTLKAGQDYLQRRRLEHERRALQALRGPAEAPPRQPPAPQRTPAPQPAPAATTAPAPAASLEGAPPSAVAAALQAAIATPPPPAAGGDSPYKLVGRLGTARRDRKPAPTPAPTTAPAPTAAPATPQPPAPRAPRSTAERLQAARVQGASCERCGLCAHRVTSVFGVGSPKADLVFIGETPSAEDERRGEPFSDEAGQLLDRMITAMRLRREDVYLCNLVLCRPPDGRNPSDEEIASCALYLDAQLRLLKPRVIVTLGPLAARALLKSDPPLGAWSAWGDTPVMPTVHPRAILDDSRHKRAAWEALQSVMARLQRRP